MDFVYVVTIYIFEFHWIKFSNFGLRLSKTTHTPAKWLGTPVHCVGFSCRLRLLLSDISMWNMDLSCPELIEVWLKHSAVCPGWPDKLMEAGFSHLNRGSLDHFQVVWAWPVAVTQERCRPPLSPLSYLPAKCRCLRHPGAPDCRRWQ